MGSRTKFCELCQATFCEPGQRITRPLFRVEFACFFLGLGRTAVFSRFFGVLAPLMVELVCLKDVDWAKKYVFHPGKGHLRVAEFVATPVGPSCRAGPLFLTMLANVPFRHTNRRVQKLPEVIA